MPSGPDRTFLRLVYPASSSLVRTRISLGVIATEGDDSSAASWVRGWSDAARVRIVKPQSKTSAHKVANDDERSRCYAPASHQNLCGDWRVSFCSVASEPMRLAGCGSGATRRREWLHSRSRELG